jgi:Transglycosylase SLT domain
VPPRFRRLAFLGSRAQRRVLVRRLRAWALASLRLSLSPPVVAVVLVCVSVVAGINSAARAWGGADVHWYTLGRLGERSTALALLGLHGVSCEDAERDPREALREAALRHGVSVRLALSVARTESSLIHTRISSTGAMGLMQLMPETARELGVDDPFDVRESADAGVRYLKQLLALYRGNARKAVAAYNAGMSRVPVKGRAQLPPETRSYVSRVFAGLPK